MTNNLVIKSFMPFAPIFAQPSDTHPENTLVAFREAIRLGAQMIEYDVALTKDNPTRYIDDTIEMKADFIQLLGEDSVDPIQTQRLRDRGIRANYCCANGSNQVQRLFEAGVEFPLVDNVDLMLRVADQNGIERLRPLYRSRLADRGNWNAPGRL